MKGKLRIYYDEEGDYLEIRIEKPRSNYGEEVNDDVTIFKDSKTDEVVGVGVLNFKKRTSKLNQVELNLPFEVNFSMLASQ